MKSFDEWFSEQGSSQEAKKECTEEAQKEYRQRIEGEFDFAELPATSNQILAEPVFDVKVIKHQGKQDLYVPIPTKAELAPDFRQEAELERWAVFEEKEHNGTIYTRIGDTIHWNNRYWGAQKMTVKAMNLIAKQYPHLYPEFEP